MLPLVGLQAQWRHRGWSPNLNWLVTRRWSAALPRCGWANCSKSVN